jgi:hypothetical protein
MIASDFIDDVIMLAMRDTTKENLETLRREHESVMK